MLNVLLRVGDFIRNFKETGRNRVFIRMFYLLNLSENLSVCKNHLSLHVGIDCNHVVNMVFSVPEHEPW